MERWQQRAVKTIGFVTVLLLGTSILYHYAMLRFEVDSQQYIHSLQVIIETYTGTGYGSDAPWSSIPVNFLISSVDLMTFLLLFIIVPYVFRPVLEEALSPSVPTQTTKTDHIAILGVDQQGRRLIDELEAREMEYILTTANQTTAQEFHKAGMPVVHGDPTATKTVSNAGIADARAVVVDLADKQSTSVILAVREVNEDVPIIALVEDTAFERHLTYAGADTVLTPRRLLGRRIAERVQAELSPESSDLIELDDTLALLELTVFEDSPVDGCSIRDVHALSEGEVTVVGLWEDGDLIPWPDADHQITPTTGLLIRGKHHAIETLEARAYPDTTPGCVVVAGYGVVGQTVVEYLTEADIDPVIIDDGSAAATTEAIDIVGDATRESVLAEAGIDTASVFVCAIAPDEQVIHSVLVADEIGDLDSIARVNDPSNDSKVRRAGADYVLALPEISGRMLALEVLPGEILSYDRQLRIERISGGDLTGQHIQDTAIADTDCIVVAIEREGTVLTEATDETVIRDTDQLVLVGTDSSIGSITR